jgi:hypothetical protein
MGIGMRRMAAALVGGGAAVLLFLGSAPTTEIAPFIWERPEPLVWRAPVRTVSIPDEPIDDPPARKVISDPPWRTVLPAGQAFLHVEDAEGFPVEEVWVSWVCVSEREQSPEIRIPVTGGERIRGLGECFFQVVSADGEVLSEDLPVSLARGDLTDIWLVINSGP